MSLHAPPCDVMPEQTLQVARAAFPTGNPSLRMRDARGPLSTNPTLAALLSHPGCPAAAAAPLARITVLPCAEGLSDAQAADAVRARIAGQDALALDLTDPGCAASVLREVRQCLSTGQAARLWFETLVTLLRARGLLKAQGRQRTDSTHVLAAIQTLNRLECVGEMLRHALNVLATAAPDWLQAWVPAAWFDRYRRRFAEYRLPMERPARYALAEQMGTDGRQLLWAIYAPATPAWRRELPALQTLRRVWLQQFYATPEGQPVRWRGADDLPPAPLLLRSPSDPAARYGKKRETEWAGYTVHLPATCDDEPPTRITEVTTTPATTADVAVWPTMPANLATRQRTPGAQLVDAGSMTSDHLLTSRTAHGRDLLGPAAADQSGQGQAGKGVAAAQCGSDWDAKHALCPQGERSVVWMERPDRHGHPTVRIACRQPICGACTRRADCTRAATAPRALRIGERAHYPALQTARACQQTDTFKKGDARRAGMEGTMAQGTRTGDLRRSRYSGCVKTRRMHLLVAAARDCMRVAAWLAEIPRAQTRPSAVAALAAAAA